MKANHFFCKASHCKIRSLASLLTVCIVDVCHAVDSTVLDAIPLHLATDKSTDIFSFLVAMGSPALHSSGHCGLGRKEAVRHGPPQEEPGEHLAVVEPPAGTERSSKEKIRLTMCKQCLKEWRKTVHIFAHPFV